MRVLVNAVIARGNRGGGATQIVLNFIRATIEDNEIEWYYVISHDFNSALNQMGIVVKNCIVVPRQPQLSSYFQTNRVIKQFIKKNNINLIFSILAPSYFFFRIPEVMRCCNAWDVIDRKDIAFSFIDDTTRIRFTIKSFFVRLMMRRAACIITQTQKAKDDILRISPQGTRVSVIPNVLPLYFKSIVVKKKNSGFYDIVYVASPTPHKNIEIIPYVAYYLTKKYCINNFRFILTISSSMNDYWMKIRRMSEELGVEANVLNVGAKNQTELVDVYNQASLGFFPSILETFSATLLEYMYFHLPIVASDRCFNREVLGEKAALYFDPLNPEKAAELIHIVMTNSTISSDLIEAGDLQIRNYLSYEKYFQDTKYVLASCLGLK